MARGLGGEAGEADDGGCRAAGGFHAVAAAFEGLGVVEVDGGGFDLGVEGGGDGVEEAEGVGESEGGGQADEGCVGGGDGGDALGEGADDYGTPDVSGVASHGRAVFVSDFLGDPGGVETALAWASDKGVRGALVQVLDPAEEEFPFDGRTIFESMGGTVRHETLRAGDLRARYLDRLAERKARLAVMAQASGWHYLCHHTGQPAQAALLWMYRALERGH